MAQFVSFIGQTIGHYRILEKLGEGGMGVVYRAHDEHLKRDVALKVLPVDVSMNPNARARLKREAQTAAALNHPNICTVYEVEDVDSTLYIAMEFVKGRTLKDLAENGLPLDVWFKHANQISEAIAHAHSLGVLHRDIKPSNVMISADGRAKVVDFGLGKRLQQNDEDATRSVLTLDTPGGFVGTLSYAAPEILQGQSGDSRSDVWSLGVLLFEMLTGVRPFKGRTTYEITSAILNNDPAVPANTPVSVKAIMQRCLQKSPSDRFQQGGEVRAALEIARANPEIGGNDKSELKKKHSTAASKWLVTVAGVVLITAISLGYRYVSNKSLSTQRQGQLAVLPITMTDTDPAMVAFGKGLVETMTARLTQLTQKHSVQVIPTSAMQSKGIATVDQARKEFGANLGLELNLQRAGDAIRINFNLIDATSMRQLGAGTVTGKMADTFNVEDLVCERVVQVLEIQLQPAERRALLVDKSSEPSAYDFYVQGLGYLKSFNRPEGFESAISVFNHALELDPNYAPAFAGLGHAYWNEYDLTKDEKWVTKAKSACQRAVELSSMRPDGHACLGLVLNGTGQYNQAMEQFEEAIRIDPFDDTPYIGLAASYEKLGRTQEAEATYRRAIQLRPSYPLTYNRLGEFQMARGQYKDAAEMFQQVIALAPDNYAGYSNLGVAYLQQNRYGEAVPLLERSISLRRTAEALSNLGTAYFQLHRFSDAARIYEEAVQVDEHNYEVWGNLGDAYFWSWDLRIKSTTAYEKASSLAMAALSVNPNDVNALGYLAEYQAMLGKRKEAMMYLRRCLGLNPHDPNLLFNAAVIYNKFGEESAALDWLQKALASGLPKSELLNSPYFDNLRGNSRFRSLAE